MEKVNGMLLTLCHMYSTCHPKCDGWVHT